MANVKFADLITLVTPHLSADPSEPVVEAAIKRAAIEFCGASWIWTYLPDAIDVVAGTQDYDIEIPNGTELAAVLAVKHAGIPLENRSIDWLNQNIENWRSEKGTPTNFTQVDTEQVLLARVPDTSLTAGLEMEIALQPSVKSKDMPGWIATRYQYQIAEGAIGHLMLMAGKPWTNEAQAIPRLEALRSAAMGARESGVSAINRAPLRTTPQH